MRKAIGFSSRRLAASKSSRLANVLVRKLRQITGGLRVAVVVLSHSLKHFLMVVMGRPNINFGEIL